jgi:membrane carboxypeptidase/penicillin-binding protein
VREGKGKTAARAELRVRPQVQGTVIVLENKSGRILAMTGGFSYPLSQLNRATQAVRQPGSAIKPLVYLAALGKGLQPNTLVLDDSITLPPVGGGRREQDYWTPENYDGSWGDTLTLRSALENSRNLATVRLLDGGIEQKPQASLDRLCELAIEAQIYRECLRYYPFVLGAQPVRPIDLAAFYAAIANEGSRPKPYVIESIERNGETIYRHDAAAPVAIDSVDRAAFFQLKTMLQGVLARGTARSIAGLSLYVAGKTGTSDEENDAWFVGFTNDVTVAVWIGYDNATGKRRTLGGGATGGAVAVPIFEPVMQAAWANVAAKTALAPPSAEAKRELSCSEPSHGRRSRKAINECLRVDARGKVLNTQYRLVSRERGHARKERNAKKDRAPEAPRTRSVRRYDNGGAARDPGYGNAWNWGWQDWRTPQRADPGFFWGNHRYW